MKVSELRELLRDRGLVVSGIKAQLVERLASGKVGKKRVGGKPWKKEALKQTPWEKGDEEENDHRSGGGDAADYVDLDEDLARLGRLEDDGQDDLAGIGLMLGKTGEGRGSKNRGKMGKKSGEARLGKSDYEENTGKRNSNRAEKMGKRKDEAQMNTGKRINNLSSQPRNLVFAKEDGDDDDEWGDDEDYDGWDDDEDDDNEEGFDPNQTVGVPQRQKKGDAPQYERKSKRGSPQYERQSEREDIVTFKEDFQGTRVFVQGLSKDATWKNLKDHFKIAGDVIYASVSIDKKTGQSKQCGIVQFETPSMAEYAIREMRNHPMDGKTLFVRKDVQESRNSNSRGRLGDDDRYGNNDRSGHMTDLPTEWRRANDPKEDGGGDDWYNLRDEELKEIESLIEKRDRQRRQKNYKMSDQLRDELKDDFGVHLDDRLKLWWTDTKHGGVPGIVSEAKGEGRWGKRKPWTQIPTDPENDSMVDSDLVMSLLERRDRARKRQDFRTADELLQRAHDSPRGGLGLRIHDESRTWRIWTDRPPPRKGETPMGYEKLTPEEMCLQIVIENEPEKVDEMKSLLTKFPGREWNIFKKLKDRYDAN